MIILQNNILRQYLCTIHKIEKIFKYPFKSKIDVDLTWFKLLKHDIIKSNKCIILRDVYVIISFFFPHT